MAEASGGITYGIIFDKEKYWKYFDSSKYLLGELNAEDVLKYKVFCATMHEEEQTFYVGFPYVFTDCWDSFCPASMLQISNSTQVKEQLFNLCRISLGMKNEVIPDPKWFFTVSLV